MTGRSIRAIVDELFYGRDPVTGQYDQLSDRFLAISAAEQRWPSDVRTYVREGDAGVGHVRPLLLQPRLHRAQRRAVAGEGPGRLLRPVRACPARRATPLVIGTTYDPATPYRGAVKLTRQLGNARLLTMRGDGHTAYGGNSPCIDAAVDAYLIDGTVPAAGTTCRQEVPFASRSRSPVVDEHERRAVALPPQTRQLGPVLRRRAIVR